MKVQTKVQSVHKTLRCAHDYNNTLRAQHIAQKSMHHHVLCLCAAQCVL